MNPDGPMADILAQAQAMQQHVLATQAEMATTEIVGEAGGGLVRITGNGLGDVTAVRVDPSVIDPSDPDTLQDLIIGALSDLSAKKDSLAAAKMGPLAGGLAGLPGF